MKTEIKFSKTTALHIEINEPGQGKWEFNRSVPLGANPEARLKETSADFPTCGVRLIQVLIEGWPTFPSGIPTFSDGENS